METGLPAAALLSSGHDDDGRWSSAGTELSPKVT